MSKGKQIDNSLYYMTLQEIADDLGVRKESVWAAEQRAVKKIRKNPYAWLLFLEHVLGIN